MDIIALMRERAAGETCPRCRRGLRDCELSLLRDDAPQFTLQVTCVLCKVTFVVVVQVRGRDEAAADRGAPVAAVGPPPPPPIAADELLELHDLLRRHRGPLTDLLHGSRMLSNGGDRPEGRA